MWDQFISVNKYHKTLDFTKSSLGFYVGYHRLITGGLNYKCKEDTEEGCHCNQSENGISINMQSLAVCVGFDGDVEFPNGVHCDLLRNQILLWQGIHGIPYENIKMHRYFNTGKTCPGQLIDQKWIDNLLRPVPPVLDTKPRDQQVKQNDIENMQRQVGILEEIVVKLRLLINIIFKHG